MASRTSNSIRNSSYALVAQVLSIILSFVTRTVFINTLGASYLGVNGLFLNILSILSFAELGLGTAIVYAMYKPLAEKNEKIVSALMNLYAKSYKVIGVVIAIIGLSLTPFLDYLIKDKPDVTNLSLIYLLFLSNSVISYFFTYKRSIIIASQNGHINTLNQVLFLVIQNIGQIVILLVFNQYILYLVIQILCTFSSNIVISNKANKMFPYLKLNRNEVIDKETTRDIKKNVLAMMSHKFGGITVTATDNLLISAFVGIYWVGLYSNYILIVGTVQSLIMQLINAITASIGNLTATEDEEKSYNIFEKLFFINFLFTVFSTTFLIVLLNPFIRIWIGEEYILDYTIVVLIVLNFGIVQMRQPAITFIVTYGLFWQIKWKSLFEAGFNLLFSLIFLKKFNLGIEGVLLGTLISNLLTNVWWEPYTIYKYGFKLKLRNYFSIYIKYILVSLFIVYVTLSVSNTVVLIGLWGLLVKFVMCLIIPSLLVFVTFYKKEEFTFTINILKKMIPRKIKKSIG